MSDKKVKAETKVRSLLWWRAVSLLEEGKYQDGVAFDFSRSTEDKAAGKWENIKGS